MEIKSKNERRRKNVSFSSAGRLMFNQMNRFQCWVVNNDVAWAKLIVFACLTTFKLTSTKHPVIKEFLQSIVELNVNVIKSMV
jgi:hypothetical protein